jgi:hypothetical protein
MRGEWLGDCVNHAIPEFVRLRSNCDALNLGKIRNGTETLKSSTKLGGGVTEAKMNL